MDELDEVLLLLPVKMGQRNNLPPGYLPIIAERESLLGYGE